MGYLGDHIGRSRCDHKNIRLLCQRYMFHLELKIPVKGVHQALRSRQGFKRRRGNKIGSILCHDHAHIRMLLHQHACQACDLVGSDSAADTQQHSFSF